MKIKSLEEKKYIVSFLFFPIEISFFVLSAAFEYFIIDPFFGKLYIIDNAKINDWFGPTFVGSICIYLLHILIFSILSIVTKVDLYRCAIVMVLPVVIIFSPFLFIYDSGFMNFLKGLGFSIYANYFYTLLQLVIFNVVFSWLDKNKPFDILRKRLMLVIVSCLTGILFGFVFCRLLWPILLGIYSLKNTIL